MHGNTITSGDHKTRPFGWIFEETATFIDIIRSKGAWPGAVHVEMTGDHVTECIGGSEPIAAENLGQSYASTCDPRLNADQSLDLAFLTAQKLQEC
jgi:3-deoxy-7-phosphoheptulonate synthase